MPMLIPDETIGLAIRDTGDWRLLALFDLSSFEDGVDKASAQSACLAAMELDRHLAADGTQVWMIKRVEAFQDGWGPALYHIAMCDAPLTCDWGHVSDTAHVVWQKFRSNPSVAFTPCALKRSAESDYRPDGLKGHWVMDDQSATHWHTLANLSQVSLNKKISEHLSDIDVGDVAFKVLCRESDDHTESSVYGM